MGIIEIGLFLMIFSHHYLVVPASPLRKASPSEFMQETTTEDEGANGHRSNGSDDDSDNSRSRIAHSGKLEHGYSHGSANGRSTSIGENGNNGGTRSPNTQGSTFVPVYTAGSVNNRHHNNHHGAANSNKKCIGLPILFTSSWASLVHLYMIF